MNGLTIGGDVNVWGGPYAGLTGTVTGRSGEHVAVQFPTTHYPVLTHRAWVEPIVEAR